MLRNFVIRLLINAVVLYITVSLLPGFTIAGEGGVVTYLVIALVLGIVNAIIRPIAFILTLPLTVITLGVFILILNALLLMLVGALTSLEIASFWWALGGGIVMGIVSMLTEQVFGMVGLEEEKRD